MIRTFYIFIVLSCIYSSMYSQKKPVEASNSDKISGPRHAVKINLTPLIFKTLSLQYELGFNKKLTAAFQFNRMFERKVPFVRFHDGKRSDPVIEGYSLTPEIRVYPWARLNRPAPNG